MSFSNIPHNESQKSCSVNVGELERYASLGAGIALGLLGLRRLDSVSGLAMTAIGGALVYRGASGHCELYRALGIDTDCKARHHNAQQQRLDEAIEESFPASDALSPSYPGEHAHVARVGF